MYTSDAELVPVRGRLLLHICPTSQGLLGFSCVGEGIHALLHAKLHVLSAPYSCFQVQRARGFIKNDSIICVTHVWSYSH